MILKLKLKRDFYSPLDKKIIKKNTILELEADRAGVILNSFWQEQFKFNHKSDIFEVLTSNSKKSSK